MIQDLSKTRHYRNFVLRLHFFQLVAELKNMRTEKDSINTSLERLKRENDLANKNVSQLRLEQERLLSDSLSLLLVNAKTVHKSTIRFN